MNNTIGQNEADEDILAHVSHEAFAAIENFGAISFVVAILYVLLALLFLLARSGNIKSPI